MAQQLSETDATLSALGAVPSNLTELVTRIAGSDFSLAAVDRQLEQLGHGVAAPPQLAPTMVDLHSPSHASPEPETFVSAEPLTNSVEWAMDVPAAPTSQSSTPPRSAPTAPPEAHTELDLASTEAAPLAELSFTDTPRVAADEVAAGDPRRDTLEDGPAVTTELPQVPALELDGSGAPAEAAQAAEAAEALATPEPLAAEPAPAEPAPAMDALAGAQAPLAADAPVAAARPSESPELSLGADASTAEADADADEFEIMVDDDLLEIVDDDLVPVEEQDKA